MTGYKFYLTKSREAADLIYNGLQSTIGKEEKVASIGSGCVNGNLCFPVMYHNDRWFYASIEYRDLNRPKYEIVFC